METPGEREPGLFASLRRLLRTVLAIGHNRLELLLVEAQEERIRFFELLLLAGLVLGLALLSLALITFTIAALCLRMGRFDLLGGVILLCLIATGVLFLRLRARLKHWTPFSATLAELKKDKQCLEEKR
jgi:uncharacterized membrane protein YqjE